jgi:hypothetical protein
MRPQRPNTRKEPRCAVRPSERQQVLLSGWWRSLRLIKEEAPEERAVAGSNPAGRRIESRRNRTLRRDAAQNSVLRREPRSGAGDTGADYAARRSGVRP